MQAPLPLSSQGSHPSPIQQQGLLPQTFWDREYKKEDFFKLFSEIHRRTATEQENVLLLNFFIVNNAPTEVVLSQIKKIQRSSINTQLQEHHLLNALAIAVLKNKFDLVKLLVQQGADVNLRDAYSWSPLHYAALLPSNEIFNFLVANGADVDAKTDAGGSYLDLQKLVGRVKVLNNPNVAIETGEDRILVDQIDRISLETIFPGFREYSDQSRYDIADFEALWKCLPEDEFMVKGTIPFLISYKDYLQSPPHLCVKVDPIISGVVGGSCYGLFADENLPVGAVVGEYAGKYKIIDIPWTFEEMFSGFSHQPYGLENFDAQEMGNAVRWANDGWPRCAVFSIYNEKGMHEKNILIVIDPEGVKAGEPIQWDYGNMLPVKWGRYVVQDTEDMEKFFSVDAGHLVEEEKRAKEQALEPFEHFLQLEPEKQTKKEFLNMMQPFCSYYSIRHKLCYPLNTPSALIYLTCREVVKPSDWKQLMQEPWIKEILDGRPARHSELMANLIGLLDSMFLELNKVDDQLKNEALELILSQIGKCTGLQLMHGIKLVTDFMKDNPVNISDEKEGNKEKWEIFKLKLMRDLPKDEEPLPYLTEKMMNEEKKD